MEGKKVEACIRGDPEGRQGEERQKGGLAAGMLGAESVRKPTRALGPPARTTGECLLWLPQDAVGGRRRPQAHRSPRLAHQLIE